jgi:hypothetical protein
MTLITNYEDLKKTLAKGVKVYHFSSYWRQWDEVLEVGVAASRPHVTVADVKTGETRHHCTNLFERGDRMQTDCPTVL